MGYIYKSVSADRQWLRDHVIKRAGGSMLQWGEGRGLMSTW